MSTYVKASEWFNANFAEFLRLIGYLETNPQPVDQLPEKIRSLDLAHGDKAAQYEERWVAAGVPYHRGLMIYLLSFLPPYTGLVRQTHQGWVDPCQWVIDRYRDEYIEIFEQVAALNNYNRLVKKYISEGARPDAAHRRAETEANGKNYGSAAADFD
jgi:hypothetical protein